MYLLICIFLQLHNWCESHDNIEIRARLYTSEVNPKPHVLELVGENCANGTCTKRLSPDNTAM